MGLGLGLGLALQVREGLGLGLQAHQTCRREGVTQAISLQLEPPLGRRPALLR